MTDAPDYPSKSELKRRSDDLQALGEELIELSDSELEALPLPDALRDAILLAQRITKHGGLYRQKQYIGKLMRKVDAEPIRAAMQARRDRERTDALRFRRLEQWRERLLNEGPEALEQLAREAPRFNVKRAAALVEQARREREQQNTPRAARELFQLVRAAFEE